MACIKEINHLRMYTVQQFFIKIYMIDQ